MSVGTHSPMSSQGLYSATDCPVGRHPPLPPGPHRSNPGLSQQPPRAVALTMGKIQVVCSDIATVAPARRLGGQEHPASLKGTGKQHKTCFSSPGTQEDQSWEESSASALSRGRAIHSEDLLEVRGGALLPAQKWGCPGCLRPRREDYGQAEPRTPGQTT